MNLTLGKITLKPEQEAVVPKLRNGNILVGGVGSGKTFTSIFWASQFKYKHIYVITTAMKRDLIEPGHDKPDWQSSLELCGFTEDDYTVDSWNNIGKYSDVSSAVFIFDEQRVVGYGAWSKHFIKIARFNKNNNWILLSATPADTWSDYIPVFIANGFYRNKSDFVTRHVEFDRWAKYPKIKAYHGTAVLEKNRRSILVKMDVERHTTRHREYVKCGFDEPKLKDIATNRWNPITDMPIQNASEYTHLVRRIVNSDEDRQNKALCLIQSIDKVVIFYNYSYELDILKKLCELSGKTYAEWNGQKHEPIPDTHTWCYLVQYTAGNDGWNCTKTDSMIFYSVNYAYKKMEQSEGRIDRMNTPFKDLKYYYLTSDSKIDKDILRAVSDKKKFNESAWIKQQFGDIFTNGK